MKYRNPTLLFLLLACSSIFISLLVSPRSSVNSQTRERRVTPESTNEKVARAPALPGEAEVVKVDVDLVTVDSLVLQKNTALLDGGLTREYILQQVEYDYE